MDIWIGVTMVQKCLNGSGTKKNLILFDFSSKNFSVTARTYYSFFPCAPLSICKPGRRAVLSSARG